MTTVAARRLHERAASGATVVVLVGIRVTDHLLTPTWRVRATEGLSLLALARLSGLTWAQLGLGRERAASGLRWAFGTVAVVAPVYLVGVLVPRIRPAFQDPRYHLSLQEALFSGFVVIPAGTVLLEEVAFRSVLWGMLSRHLRTRQVLGTTSALFGLWHVFPSRHLAAGEHAVSDDGEGALIVAATVALTTLGGLLFGELRRRSGSVLAGAGAHWATNALGVLFGLLAWHLAGEAITPETDR
jgi:membrane protease YdiL (CAAX protease family)